MFTHPCLTSELARDRQREMLAEARPAAAAAPAQPPATRNASGAGRSSAAS